MAFFRKLSGTFYRKEGRLLKAYKPGMVIECNEEELRKTDADLKTWVFVKDSEPVADASTESDQNSAKIAQNSPSDAKTTQTSTTKLSRTKNALKVVSRADDDGFDVINTKSGLAINDNPLTEEEAFALAEEFKVGKK